MSLHRVRLIINTSVKRTMAGRLHATLEPVPVSWSAQRWETPRGCFSRGLQRIPHVSPNRTNTAVLGPLGLYDGGDIRGPGRFPLWT